MHCKVEPDHRSPIAKSTRILLVTILHITKAVPFFIIALLYPSTLLALAWIGLFELLVARWFWSLRMEAWGIAMGFCVFHLLLPVTSSISIIASWFILVLSALEIVILFLVQREGYFNFSQILKSDKGSIDKPMVIQKHVFYLIIIAQVFKAIFVLIGTYIVFLVEGITGTIPWLLNVPRVPLLLGLGVINLVPVFGLYLGKAWAFHLTVVMAVVGFVETLFAWMPLIILISVWIIVLMLPCWAKDGFYLRFMNSQK